MRVLLALQQREGNDVTIRVFFPLHVVRFIGFLRLRGVMDDSQLAQELTQQKAAVAYMLYHATATTVVVVLIVRVPGAQCIAHGAIKPSVVVSRRAVLRNTGE